MRYATLALILISGPAYAVPSITGLNGLFNHGSTVTITGSSFGTRGDYNGSSHAIADFMPVLWKDFEDSTLVSDGMTVENNHTQSWVVESLDAKTNSAKHGRRIYYPHGDGLERISGLNRTQAGTTGKYFISFWHYNPAISTVTMIDGGKYFRIYGSTTQRSIYLGNVEDSSEFLATSECLNCTGYSGTAQHSLVPGNKLGQWERIDLAMMDTPSEFVAYRNMQKMYCISLDTSTFTNCVRNFKEQFVSTPFGGEGQRLLFGHDLDGPSLGADGGYQRVDDLYADYSPAHAEVCNQSTWNALITGGGSSTTAHCEVQIPTAWSNTSITINLNTGSFASGTTVYAYVITASGTPESFDVNPAGFSLVVGETGSGGSGGEEQGGDEASTNEGVLIGWDATP